MRTKEVIQGILFGSTYKNQRGRSVEWISKLCFRTSFICMCMNKNFYYQVAGFMSTHLCTPLGRWHEISNETVSYFQKAELKNIKQIMSHLEEPVFFTASKVKDTISCSGNSTDIFSFSLELPSLYSLLVYWLVWFTDLPLLQWGCALLMYCIPKFHLKLKLNIIIFLFFFFF